MGLVVVCDVNRGSKRKLSAKAVFVEWSKMPDRCVVSVVANCSNAVNREIGIFVHIISFFFDLQPEAKKRPKNNGGTS